MKEFRREVVFIEQHETSNGARFFGLWLKCGHYVTRGIPTFHIGRFWKAPPITPQTVDCMHCESGMAEVPLPDSLFQRFKDTLQ